MTKLPGTVVAMLLCILYSGCSSEKKSTRSDAVPNIIYINVDDFGWRDTGVYGSDFYETPNIDKLAAEGMKFMHAYAAASNCAPSRACLMSGEYTPRHGIYTVGSSERGKSKDRKLIPTPNVKILPDSVITIAEELKRAGYFTVSIGKWHIGEDPRTQGFDINIAGNRAGHPKTYFSPYHNKDLPDGPKGEYLTDRLTTEAIKIIKENSERKFFLYLPYYAVHTPHQAKEDLIKKYKEKQGTAGQHDPVYAAMIETLDNNIGRLIKTVNKLGLRKKTIIVFTSDNGGIAAVSSQAPLRAGKGSYYEGGTRVPLIISWKNKISPGTSSDVPVSNIDFYPTFLELAGIEKSKDKLLDGISIVPVLLQNGNIPDRNLFWHFPIYLQAYDPKKDEGRDSLFRTRPGSTILSGDWKLHEYFENNEIELYNLRDDKGEQKDIKEMNTSKKYELLEVLQEWRKETRALVPTQLNPDYVPPGPKK